jgi:hypothetical protein
MKRTKMCLCVYVGQILKNVTWERIKEHNIKSVKGQTIMLLEGAKGQNNMVMDGHSSDSANQV